MQDVGCRMLDVGCQPPVPAQLRGGEGLFSVCNGKLRSPIWPRSQHGWKPEPLQKSDTCIHIYSVNPGNLLPVYEALGGESSVGKARRREDFSKEEARVSPPCPKSHP